MAYQPSESAGYMLNLAARLISQRTAELLAPLGVAPAYLPVIFALADASGSTQIELAERVSIVAPTMTRTLKRMERDGLIVRAVDVADRRRAIVRLSDRAQSLLPQIEKIAVDMNASATSGLPPGGEVALLDMLARIVGNLRAFTGPAGSSSPGLPEDNGHP